MVVLVANFGFQCMTLDVKSYFNKENVEVWSMTVCIMEKYDQLDPSASLGHR